VTKPVTSPKRPQLVLCLSPVTFSLRPLCSLILWSVRFHQNWEGISQTESIVTPHLIVQSPPSTAALTGPFGHIRVRNPIPDRLILTRSLFIRPTRASWIRHEPICRTDIQRQSACSMWFPEIRSPASLRLTLGDSWDQFSSTPSPFVVFKKKPHDSHPSLDHLVVLVFGAVLEVVCVSLPGYIIARLGHFDADKQKFLANLNVMLFTPCLSKSPCPIRSAVC